MANRMSSAKISGGTETYLYGADNKRLSKITVLANGALSQTVYIYGVGGEKLGVATNVNGIIAQAPPTGDTPRMSDFAPALNVYWAGRLIKQGQISDITQDTSWVETDRLGSVRGFGQSGYLSPSTYYLPYGDELTATGNDKTKFATYTRDTNTGLDYADQRYFTSKWGRFMSADRFKQAAKANDSGSWNKYSYTRGGDPINRNDSSGKTDCWIDSPDPGDCGPCGEGEDCNPDPVTGPPTQPSCSIFLFKRPVGVLGISLVANHTYLFIQDSSGLSTIEGGPDLVSAPVGYLIGTLSNPIGNGLAGTDPRLFSNVQGGPAYTGSLACADAPKIETNESKYNGNGQWAKYDPTALFGYNSNSFTYTLLNDVGLSGFFGSLGWFPTTPGWGQVVPAL